MLWHKTYSTDSSHEWIVLIHGAGGSSTIWHPQLRQFTSSHNVLILDLRGHGRSIEKNLPTLTSYTFKTLIDDVFSVLDSLKIDRAHFIGVSLGTLLIRELTYFYPDRVHSVIHTGAITELDLRSKALIQFGHLAKSWIPFYTLYKLFAWIIMPGKAHRPARELFKQQASQISQDEFLRWFELTHSVDEVLERFSNVDSLKPTLFIMGDQDHLFLHPVTKIVSRFESAELLVLDKCGHVCNIEKPEHFNKAVLEFIEKNRYHVKG